MKSTEAFKKAIREYLEKRALEDPSFGEKYHKEGKNIDDCTTYILNTVKKSGCNGFADDEIYGMAVHYYDEEKIDTGGAISGDVVVNHRIELTEEEKTEMREKAKKEFENIELTKLRQSQERKEAREKKRQETLKKQEEERKQQRAEAEKKIEQMQQTLF